MVDYENSVFISYAWGGESEAIVNQIDQALQERGITIIRDKRDLGYKGSISAFMERIGQGNCVIVVISDKYLRSPNCMFELVEIADGKQFHDRVFPIVLSNAEIYDPVKRLEYVKHWEDKLAELDNAMRGVKSQANLQGIREEIDQYDRIRDKISGLTSILKDMNTLTPEMHKDSDFSEIYAGIEQRMAGKQGQVKPETGESPYMGLRYFDTSDADLFYGREALTCELAERVSKESFLAIVGASGSGKSSVARAGLIPAWQKENERGVVHVITPTAHSLESLAASLTRDSESVTATSTLMDDMGKDSRSLRLYIKKLLSNSENSNLLLVVDQFEETFTLCKDLDERKAFIENLLSLAEEENSSSRVVITLRADFYHHCFEYEGLRLTLEKHQANLGAMTQDELREAILQPAENNNWKFQDGLVEQILQDVGSEPGALPLLSHALLETWKRRQGRTLTLQGYHEAGGVKKAITQTAESVYDKLSSAEQEIARSIFLRLTELGEGTQDTRRRVKMDELAQAKEQEAATKVLKTLTDARLVTTEQDSAEVAHEALIREWGTLRKWLDQDRESLRLHRQLTESSLEWERSGRDESFLVHRSGRLDDVLTFKESSNFAINSTEKVYLDACVELMDKERRAREKRFRSTLFASMVASVIFLSLAGFGLIKSREAEKQANNALARQLAIQAQSINPTRDSREIITSLIAIQSLKVFPNAEAASLLINNHYGVRLTSSMTHDDSVLSVSFSPDGKYVVSASLDHTARVWEAATGKEIARMTHDDTVYSAAFSPDGRYVVSASLDHTARVWEAVTGKEIARMTHDSKVYLVAFSPDGKYVVSGSSDKTARVWVAATGKEIARMTHDGLVYPVVFSPDGRYVVSGSYDHTARVWVAATGTEVARITHDSDV